MISLLLNSFIWNESISFHLLSGSNIITVLLSFTWNMCQSRKQYNNIHRNQSCVTAFQATDSDEVAWDFTGSTELNWALKPAFHFEKHLPVSIFAFLGSGSLLSFTECWALWCPAQYKCLRSHYFVYFPRMSQFAKRLSSMHPNWQNSTLKALPSEEMFRLKEIRCKD